MNKIQEKRLQLGWSRAEMSRKLDIPIRTLESWESGERTPPVWAEKLVLEKMEQALKEASFETLWKDAKETKDVDVFVSDWALSSVWGEGETDPIPEARIKGLQIIWQAAQDSDDNMLAKAVFLNLF